MKRTNVCLNEQHANHSKTACIRFLAAEQPTLKHYLRGFTLGLRSYYGLPHQYSDQYLEARSGPRSRDRSLTLLELRFFYVPGFRPGSTVSCSIGRSSFAPGAQENDNALEEKHVLAVIADWERQRGN